MRRPAWLPPLNSHENYSIDVVIHQCAYSPPSMRSRPSQNLKSIGIMFMVDVKFYSDDNNKGRHSPFNALSLCQAVDTLPVPALGVDLRERVNNILGNREFVPFKLDKIGCYRETDEVEPMPDQSYDNPLPISQHALASRITNFLSCTMSQYRQTGDEQVAIVLFITKLVTIPDQEFQAWTSWYEEQKRVNPHGFEEEYFKAISVPRTTHELWYESSMLAYESAAKSCIESLEKLAIEEDGDSEAKSCTICFEDLRKGEQVTKLPCSHVFHGDCVIHWLKTSHFCPSCRFILPTSS